MTSGLRQTHGSFDTCNVGQMPVASSRARGTQQQAAPAGFHHHQHTLGKAGQLAHSSPLVLLHRPRGQRSLALDTHRRPNAINRKGVQGLPPTHAEPMMALWRAHAQERKEKLRSYECLLDRDQSRHSSTATTSCYQQHTGSILGTARGRSTQGCRQRQHQVASPEMNNTGAIFPSD